MKKTLTTIALAIGLIASASATTLVTEYNYNVVAGSGPYKHAQYGYVGLAQSLGKFGVVDGGLQYAWATTNGFSTDRQNGWEVGYSYPLSFGKIAVTPRFATGAMNNIDPAGAGFQLRARYWLGSVEAAMPIAKNLGGYVSVSHMNGINSDSIARANRVQAGVDLTVAKNFGVRAGYSYQKFGSDSLNGLVLVGSYSF